MKNQKKQQSNFDLKTSDLRHSNTKVIPTYQEGGESCSGIREKREKEEVLSPTIYNRYADMVLLFSGVFIRFSRLVKRSGSGDVFAMFMMWLFILGFGAGGCTINGLLNALLIVGNNYNHSTTVKRLRLLRSYNLVSIVRRGRYSYYVVTRYAEKNILNFEIAKSDIVSFVASFRRVMKEQSRPAGKV